MDIAVGSEQGVFSKHNSDAYLSAALTPKAMFFGVADGFGAVGPSMSAAMTALVTVRDYLHGRRCLGVNGPIGSPAGIRSLLLSALDYANAQLYACSGSHEDYVASGTSLTVAIIVGRCAFVGHAGDAGAYLLRFGNMERITNDDALFAEVLTSVKAGVPAKPRMRGVLWRSLGTQAKLEASVVQVDLLPTDQLLLCTDGVHHCVSSDEMCDVLLESYTASDVVARLLATTKMRGRLDNATLLVVRNLLAPTMPSARRFFSLAGRSPLLLFVLSVLFLILFLVIRS